MEESLQFYREHYYIILTADLIFGLLLGLIPLIFGIKKQKRGLGIIGLIVSVVVSVATPVLSIISTIIFTLLIFKKPKPVEAVVINEKSIDGGVKNPENL